MLKKIYFSVFLLPLSFLWASDVSEIDCFSDGAPLSFVNDKISEIDLLPSSTATKKKKKPPFPGSVNDGNQAKANHDQASDIHGQMLFFIPSNPASPTGMMESGSNMLLSESDPNSVLISRKGAALLEERRTLQAQHDNNDNNSSGSLRDASIKYRFSSLDREKSLPTEDQWEVLRQNFALQQNNYSGAKQTTCNDDDNDQMPSSPLKKPTTQDFPKQERQVLLRENHFSDESVRAFNQQIGAHLSYPRKRLHREISSANSINEEQENQQRDLNSNQKELNNTQQQGVTIQQGVTKFSNINFTESTMGLGRGMPSVPAFEDSDDE